MAQKTNPFIIQFDSSTALLKNLALCLNNQDLMGVGVAPPLPPWVETLLNAFPFKVRQAMYSWGGWLDAITPGMIKDFDIEEVARWVTSFYPQSDFNGVMFGSSNGAAVHLAAALGMPWIPQTYLVAMRRRVGPDQIREDMAWGRETIKPLLQKNPGIHAAQMHDPIQDRLMVAKMGYFRIKVLSLPTEFTNFIQRHTDAKRPLVTVECDYSWPTFQIQDHHTFQLGGFGAIDPYEYLEGSPRIREFLRKSKSTVSDWGAFKPTGEHPEAEWGFYPQALEDLRTLAAKNKATFYRLVFHHPEGLSAFTCDLYRWWYNKWFKSDSKRLLIENFALISPYRVLTSRTLPFWLAFNTKDSMELVRNYIYKKRFEEIYVLLMSNGVKEEIDLTSIDDWKKVARMALRSGCLVGVDEHKYPLDFATFISYQRKLKECLPDVFKSPPRLTMDEIKTFLAQNTGKPYPLTLHEFRF